MALGVAAAILVAGCSALTFTYNHAERLLLWKIDRYFYLSHEQEGLVQGRLADLHRPVILNPPTRLPHSRMQGVHTPRQQAFRNPEVVTRRKRLPQRLRRADGDEVSGYSDEETRLFSITVGSALPSLYRHSCSTYSKDPSSFCRPPMFDVGQPLY